MTLSMDVVAHAKVLAAARPRREPRVAAAELGAMWMNGEPLSALVCYDRAGARMLDGARIDIAVVSFSDGTPPGVPDEHSATVSDLLAAIAEVRAANEHSFVVGDLPLEIYRTRRADTTLVARRFLEAGADAVKIEGGRDVAPVIRELRGAGVPVVGHIGYTPKTGMRMRTRGRATKDAVALCEDALALKAAGAIALVLELVDERIAACVTAMVDVPTLGIYSGACTSGQVLVLNDVLDVTRFDPAVFPKGRPARIGSWQGAPEERVRAFHAAVKARAFPETAH